MCALIGGSGMLMRGPGILMGVSDVMTGVSWVLTGVSGMDALPAVTGRSAGFVEATSLKRNCDPE